MQKRGYEEDKHKCIGKNDPIKTKTNQPIKRSGNSSSFSEISNKQTNGR